MIEKSGNLEGTTRAWVVDKIAFPLLGFAILIGLWAIGSVFLSASATTSSFEKFGLIPTIQAVPGLISSGYIADNVAASGYRLGIGMLLSILIGVPIGIAIGLSRMAEQITNEPFQLLRMVSPLSWMPIVVFVFPLWDQAIIFLIAIAAVWPVVYATAAGLKKVDPAWFKVSKNLGASFRKMLTHVIFPAIAFDIFTGIRLALGVAWVVLVPAELLGVSSGLGYAIKDARETLAYDHLTAMVVVIGIIGFALDTMVGALIKKYSWQKDL
ncbi:MAG: ABC transporter permease subunit [Gammaproteobacteria bacterium]